MTVYLFNMITYCLLSNKNTILVSLFTTFQIPQFLPSPKTKPMFVLVLLQALSRSLLPADCPQFTVCFKQVIPEVGD